MPWPLALLTAFLCGSIPFGFIIGRAKGIDIREHGSRNIGATNVGRVLGRRWGFICFGLDAGKGFLPTALAGILNGGWGLGPDELAPATQWWWLATALAALLGHIYSPWVRFRGGKGVATGFGALLAVWPALTAAAAIALVAWLLLVAATRYVSLSSMVAAVTIPATVALWASLAAGSVGDGLRSAAPLLVMTGALAALVVVRHRANLARLLRGVEPRVGRRSGSTA